MTSGGLHGGVDLTRYDVPGHQISDVVYDQIQPSLGQIAQFLRQLGNPYVAVAYDPEGVAGLDWGVYGAPETFLLDPDGVIVYKRIGALTAEIWREEILPRLDDMSRRSPG